MTVDPVDTLSSRRRALALARVVRAALHDYDLEASRVRFVSHRLSTTFRVSGADGTAYAMKIGRPGLETQATLASENAFVAWLHGAGLAVPRPLTTRRGALAAELTDFEAGTRPAAVVTWLPGRALRTNPSVRLAREIGRLTAQIHERSRTFVASDGFDRKTWTPDRMAGRFAGPTHPADGILQRADAELVAWWRARVDERWRDLRGDRREHGLIVADIGPHNVLWHRGRASLIDFNDTGWGLYAYDVALAREYLVGRPGGDVLASALLDGYRQRTALPAAYAATPEVFAAATLLRRLHWDAGKPRPINPSWMQRLRAIPR